MKTADQLDLQIFHYGVFMIRKFMTTMLSFSQTLFAGGNCPCTGCDCTSCDCANGKHCDHCQN